MSRLRRRRWRKSMQQTLQLKNANRQALSVIPVGPGEASRIALAPIQLNLLRRQRRQSAWTFRCDRCQGWHSVRPMRLYPFGLRTLCRCKFPSPLLYPERKMRGAHPNTPPDDLDHNHDCQAVGTAQHMNNRRSFSLRRLSAEMVLRRARQNTRAPKGSRQPRR